MLFKGFKALLVGVSFALVGVTSTSCSGGDGGEDNGVYYAEHTTDISVSAFLSGQSYIYLMNTNNGMREVLIVADAANNVAANASRGNGTCTVTFTGQGLVIPYKASFSINKTNAGVRLVITFDEFEQAGARYNPYMDAEKCKQLMHVNTPAHLTGFYNGVTVGLEFEAESGMTVPIVADCTTTAGTAQWYDDEGEYVSNPADAGWNASKWATECMTSAFFAVQPVGWGQKAAQP